MKRIYVILITVAASVLAGGATAWIVADKVSSTTQQQSTLAPSTDRSFDAQKGAKFTSYQKQEYPDLTYAAENAVKAVVNIEVTAEVSGSSYGGQLDPFFEFFGVPQGSRGNSVREQRVGGSGVIISSDGYIVTNNHVIANAKKVKVKLNDDRTFEAKVIGTDPTTEVALIKIDANDLPTLAFGSSDDLRLGEWVLAIGSPLDLRSTITAGIVSAKARSLGAIQDSAPIESFIQTDAAVNPGNSGGALVNTAGELVGINTLITSQTGSYIGYSFAVPSSIVKKVVMDLKEYGVVQRAMLGISYRAIDDDFLEQFGEKYGLTETGGLYVADVTEGGGAEAAGIKKGDVLIELDNVSVTNSAKLNEVMASHRPNDKVTVKVKRDGKVKQFEVVLRNKAGKAELVSKDDVDVARELGGEFAELSDKAKKDLKIDGGIKVTRVKEGGLLQRAKVNQGFVITHINDHKIGSVSDLDRITSKIESIDGIYYDPIRGINREVRYSLVN